MAGTTDAPSVDVVSPAQQEGTKAVLRAWFKAVGDTVLEGEPLVELETDKVALEIAAPASGRLAAILVRDGSVEPGDLLGRIEPGTRQEEFAGSPAPSPPRDAPASDNGPVPLQRFDPELRLSPAVRRLLMESGLDPKALTGTGKDGRLTREDVQNEIDRRKSGPDGDRTRTARQVDALIFAERALPGPASGPAVPSYRIPHDSMRRRIAEHMTRSVAMAPHVTTVFEADFSAIMAHRRTRKSELETQGVNLTLTAYLVQACIEAMKAAPVVNSRWHEDDLEVFTAMNIGIGTALGDKGLVVPVIHDAQTLSLTGIAKHLQDLTTRARNGKLTPADVQNGTFTISNHGVSGSLLAAPIIINQPQSAILGIGKVEKRVVVREVDGVDAIQVRPMSYVSLTIDHRVVDGAQANAWLTRFADVIETWPGT